ncbi:unnamed protein product [Prorocentrum cordatum]|uniref:Uncharacterized protein n=1 Tax=Prorocentrum cordatum TaxID=2364126 RepID=A0ABN9U259_9DINO|nr:unnamed protein product [Polarella glacialis]
MRRFYNAGISLCKKRKQRRRALSLSSETWDEKLELDIISYSDGVSACKKGGGQWQSVVALLSEMHEAKMEPNWRLSHAPAAGACDKSERGRHRSFLFSDSVAQRHLGGRMARSTEFAWEGCARSASFKNLAGLVMVAPAWVRSGPGAGRHGLWRVVDARRSMGRERSSRRTTSATVAAPVVGERTVSAPSRAWPVGRGPADRGGSARLPCAERGGEEADTLAPLEPERARRVASGRRRSLE